MALYSQMRGERNLVPATSNLVGNKWIYSLSCANIGKEFDIVKEYTIIFKKETYVVEVQAYNEMGKTKWTPVIEDEMLILYF